MQDAVQDLLGSHAPAWLLAGDGRVVMTLLTLLLVYPLCCLRGIREVCAGGWGGGGMATGVGAVGAFGRWIA